MANRLRFLSLAALVAVLVSITPAHAGGGTTAGGWIPGVAGGRATFGMSADETPTGSIRGHLTYTDQSVGFHLRSTTILHLGHGPCITSFGGTDDNGNAFFVTVTDNGEPGANNDTFTIVAIDQHGNPYANANTLGAGNVQISSEFCP